MVRAKGQALPRLIIVNMSVVHERACWSRNGFVPVPSFGMPDAAALALGARVLAASSTASIVKFGRRSQDDGLVGRRREGVMMGGTNEMDDVTDAGLSRASRIQGEVPR